jgi:quercetin dioxygenase-like cupin family protein
MKKITSLVIAVGAAIAITAYAQTPGFTRTPLQSQDLSIPNKVVVQAKAEFEPGVAAGRHTHPGEEIGYILEGQLELKVDGQPTRIVKAGEVFFVPAGLIHDGINNSNAKTKVLATYVVEKGNPVATPAP